MPQTTPLPQPSQPQSIDRSALRISTPPQTLSASINNLRSGQLHLDTFSPINQNGAFEFDRVIKSGTVSKRTRKTKTWKPIHLVLRPNLLSIYRDRDETKLRHQINLSDLTAVARQKDPKGKAKHAFALFSPSRNYHLEAKSDKDVQEWVELIRREARIDEEEEDMVMTSPNGARSTYHGFERHNKTQPQSQSLSQDPHTGYSSSDPEPVQRSRPGTQMHSARRPSHTLEYSGNEYASNSDFSDSAGGAAARMSNLSLVLTETQYPPPAQPQGAAAGTSPRLTIGTRNASQMSGLNISEAMALPKQDDERVICHGWMFLLKSRSGVRQWKKVWMVLRPKNLALYKNEDEYSAMLIIPFHNIVNAVEIDPVSRSKKYCLQIITEERNYRYCAPDDDSLARWLGAFKSLLVKRKEMELQRLALQNQSQSQLPPQAPPQQQQQQQQPPKPQPPQHPQTQRS
ncbi:hypothetical protein AAFC00_002808 [Neodothiora populina]